MTDGKLTIIEAIGYVRQKYGLAITRQTIYNWINHGRRNEKLQHGSIPAGAESPFKSIQFTTGDWIDEFFDRSGLSRSLA